jgi:hypothetical protein
MEAKDTEEKEVVAKVTEVPTMAVPPTTERVKVDQDTVIMGRAPPPTSPQIFAKTSTVTDDPPAMTSVNNDHDQPPTDPAETTSNVRARRPENEARERHKAARV